MAGNGWLDTDFDVYNVLKDFIQKKQDIVKDFQTVLARKGYDVTDELAEQLTTQALKNLKKDGKAENPSYGMWKKI